MSARMEASGGPRCAGLRGWIDRIVGDRRGVAAVEFALIVPLLLCMYLLTMEASQGIETNKKVSRAASMVADLVAQQQTITATDVTAIMQIGQALLQPYNRSKATITVIAIQLNTDPTPKAQILWSYHLDEKSEGAPATGLLAKNSFINVPTALQVPGSFLIRVDAELKYKPVITYTSQEAHTLGVTDVFNNIDMGEKYYLRPRMSTQVTCANC